ncbi:hypothetical protein D3C87_259720 [compost metagenome]
MSLIISLLTTLTMAHAADVADPANCTYLVERQDGTQFQRMWSESTQACFISVHPLDSYYDMVYRDHLFTSDGLLMVFNSFGPGEDSSSTGAREFFMFPRPQKEITHQWDTENKLLTITHVTGDKFVFDARKARLVSMTRADVSVASSVDPKNRGGIEITNFQGLMMDGGWSVGSSPTGNKRGVSQFKDSAGKTCNVKNSDLFRYTSGGDAILRYKDDASLQKFLKGQCPQLKAL